MRPAAALAFALGLTLWSSPGRSAGGADPLFQDLPERLIPTTGKRLIHPAKARSFALDLAAVESVLRTAPRESAGADAALELSLPMPDGGSGRFLVWQSPVMQAGLAAKYPRIRTYAGRGIDDPQATLRLQTDAGGLRAAIRSPRGAVYIDPYARGDRRHHQSYYKRDLANRHRLADQVIVDERTAALPAARLGAKGVSIGGDLRTYRVAIATSGEYAQFHGGEVEGVLSELVNVVNRVTGVYERDFAVRLELIDGNDALIFTSPLIDPYLNDQGTQMLLVNSLILNLLVGPGAYDIGHVVSTGGGGVAGLGVVCGFNKGQGVTGLPTPVGDPFYIDYVAHEMGHQFGANHTFNGSEGSCAGGNRNGSTAYEPGSGTTIMGYAGICGEQDIQPNSDDDFHAVSFDEVVAFTREGGGASCGVVSDTGNQPPVAVAGNSGLTIPMQTPFELTGSGSDPDGDPISYDWEQFDLGAAGAPNEPDATAPLFRSFVPTSSPTRSFPQLSDLLASTQTIGEILPAISRDLNFRLTVRDMRMAPSAGGVASDDLLLKVSDSAGPFRISNLNEAASLNAGQSLELRWDVAGTDQPPVACARVDISLSVDGGQTFDRLLLAGTANDGAESFSLPAGVGSEAARLKLKCADNVFFDISDADLALLGGSGSSSGGSSSGSGSGSSSGGSSGTGSSSGSGSSSGARPAPDDGDSGGGGSSPALLLGLLALLMLGRRQLSLRSAAG